MNVFVLLGQINYEGDTLLGVYLSMDAAINAQSVMSQQGILTYDAYKVDEREVDAPASIDSTEYYI